ncbi:hypothetical protein M5689_007227 [Euphorbia peplus]|nr:hypothetical protein M5689_007227 [Euphorbia peplus]
MQTFFPLLLILLSTKFPKSFATDDYRYSNCSQTFQCGSITDINYPFWGENRPDYCGRPGFHLSCKDNNTLIKFNSNTFRVLEINPENQALRVAREDYFNDICPDHFHNTSIDFTSFNYAPRLRNLTLIYGCNTVSSGTYLELLRQPDCFINSTNINVYCVPMDVMVNRCNSSVIIPVMETNAVIVENNDMKVIDAFKEGFELEWKIGNDQCKRCTDSGGICGFNTTTDQSTCFCHDQSTVFSCASRSGMSLFFFMHLETLCLTSSLAKGRFSQS